MPECNTDPSTRCNSKLFCFSTFCYTALHTRPPLHHSQCTRRRFIGRDVHDSPLGFVRHLFDLMCSRALLPRLIGRVTTHERYSEVHAEPQSTDLPDSDRCVFSGGAVACRTHVMALPQPVRPGGTWERQPPSPTEPKGLDARSPVRNARKI